MSADDVNSVKKSRGRLNLSAFEFLTSVYVIPVPYILYVRYI